MICVIDMEVLLWDRVSSCCLCWTMGRVGSMGTEVNSALTS